MSITQFNLEPGLKWAASMKRGDVRSLAFTVEGFASLADDDWGAVARFRNGIDVVVLDCTAALATVSSPDDSTRVTVTWTEAQANAFRLGVYAVDIKDHDTNQTWGTGTLEISRNTVP